MSELQPTISRIAQKMQQLLKQQDQLRKENEKLRAGIAQKEEELKEERDKSSLLEEKVAILRSAAGNLDEQSKKEFEKKINQYLKDIDRVIVHLNG
jgi:predicted nuclease with TOPRIM domain